MKDGFVMRAVNFNNGRYINFMMLKYRYNSNNQLEPIGFAALGRLALLVQNTNNDLIRELHFILLTNNHF